MPLPADRTGLKAGFFLIFSLAAAVAVIGYIGVKKQLFAEKAVYRLISPTGENIELGMPVKLQGFKIGQVDSVRLLDLNVVEVDVSILKEYKKWFTSEAKLSLENSLIGGSYLKLEPGPKGSPVISEGASIPLAIAENLQDVLKRETEKVLADVKIIVANARIISQQIVDPDGPMQKILSNARDISGNLASDRGLLKYLADDPRPAREINDILDKADASVASLHQLLEGLNGRVANIGQLQERIESLVETLTQVVAEYKGLREDLGPTLRNVEAITGEVRNATTDLYSLRNKAEYGLRLGNEVLLRLKNTWPLSGGAPENQPRRHPEP
ncbi:MAG: MlaD family protein [Desulfovibrionaceae bacterium]